MLLLQNPNLSMFERSGVSARSVFIKAHFFGRQFRVLTEDKNLVEYYARLSFFHAQYRAVGNNYNQVVKELRCHFSEKKVQIGKMHDGTCYRNKGCGGTFEGNAD